MLDVKKMAPDAEGKMRKLPEDVRAEEGRALARLGDGGWDPLVQPGRRDGRFDDELVAAAAEAVRTWRAPVRVGRRGPVAPQRRARARLRAPRSPTRSACRSTRCSSASATTRRSARWPTRPSRSRTCAASSRVTGAPPPEPCLLVDDIRFSGWTLAMVAGQLRRRGARPGLPARAVNGVLTESNFSAAGSAEYVSSRGEAASGSSSAVGEQFGRDLRNALGSLGRSG